MSRDEFDRRLYRAGCGKVGPPERPDTEWRHLGDGESAYPDETVFVYRWRFLVTGGTGLTRIAFARPYKLAEQRLLELLAEWNRQGMLTGPAWVYTREDKT